MTDITETFKNNPLSAVLIAIVLGSGGLNYVSESAEETADDAFRQADIIQDQNYADLLQKYNDLNTELALIKQKLE